MLNVTLCYFTFLLPFILFIYFYNPEIYCLHTSRYGCHIAVKVMQKIKCSVMCE